MEITVMKRKSFKYVDFLEFQVGAKSFTISPSETDYDEEKVTFIVDNTDADGKPISFTPELMFGSSLSCAQLCADDDDEIYLEGDAIFEYLDPVIKVEYGFAFFQKDFSVRQVCVVNNKGEVLPLISPKGIILVNGVELSMDSAKHLAQFVENDKNALRALVKELDCKEFLEYGDGIVQHWVVENLALYLHLPSTYLTERDGDYEKEFLKSKCSDLINDIAASVVSELVDMGVTTDTLDSGFVTDDEDINDYIDAFLECNGEYRKRIDALQQGFEQYMATA